MESENIVTKINEIIASYNHSSEECDRQIKTWQEKKRQIQKEMRSALETIQQKCSFRKRNEPAIGILILDFIKRTGHAKLGDIKKYLLSNGRTTNPGAALTRLVKKGILESPQRGSYTICERSAA